jgi:hypothetical protein
MTIPPLTATVVAKVGGGDAINYSLATTALKFSNVVTTRSRSPWAATRTHGDALRKQDVVVGQKAPRRWTTRSNYGDDNPALTVTVTGTVNGDTLNYTLATSALKFSDVGNYPIHRHVGQQPELCGDADRRHLGDRPEVGVSDGEQ